MVCTYDGGSEVVHGVSGDATQLHFDHRRFLALIAPAAHRLAIALNVQRQVDALTDAVGDGIARFLTQLHRSAAPVLSSLLGRSRDLLDTLQSRGRSGYG
ncbi:hypothetical protein, partial [Mycobacteroides abscessus]|uniref:hypothetical protein n=1 Tax=Mycobacteroides abscessus TaxID=36809 RepID=UPI0019D080FE